MRVSIVCRIFKHDMWEIKISQTSNLSSPTIQIHILGIEINEIIETKFVESPS